MRSNIELFVYHPEFFACNEEIIVCKAELFVYHPELSVVLPEFINKKIQQSIT